MAGAGEPGAVVIIITAHQAAVRQPPSCKHYIPREFQGAAG